MRLADIVSLERVSLALHARTKKEALDELAKLFGEPARGGMPAEDVARLMMDRESLASTGVGSGVAIPHARVETVEEVVAAVAVSAAGVDFDSIDGQPVHVFVCLIAPRGGSGVGATQHLRALARISRVMRDPTVRRGLREAASPEAALEVLFTADGR